MMVQFKAVLDAAGVVREAAMKFESSLKALAEATEENTALVRDFDQKADLKRSLEADVARLNAERSDADAKAAAAKAALAQIRKNLG